MDTFFPPRYKILPREEFLETTLSIAATAPPAGGDRLSASPGSSSAYTRYNSALMDDDEKQKNVELAEKLKAEQNFTAAVIAGIIAMLLAAVAYGLVVEAWPFSYGFAAAGVGVVIGFFMKFLGRGISMKFSVAAATFKIVGCVLGNLFVKIVHQAQANSASPIDLLRSHSLSELGSWSVSGLYLIHLVFWFVAVAAAVFLAKRPLSRAQRLAIGLHDLRG